MSTEVKNSMEVEKSMKGKRKGEDMEETIGVNLTEMRGSTGTENSTEVKESTGTENSTETIPEIKSEVIAGM